MVLRPHCIWVILGELTKVQVPESHPKRFWLSGLWLFIYIKYPDHSNVILWSTHLKEQTLSRGEGSTQPSWSLHFQEYFPWLYNTGGLLQDLSEIPTYTQTNSTAVSVLWIEVAPEPPHGSGIKGQLGKGLTQIVGQGTRTFCWNGSRPQRWLIQTVVTGAQLSVLHWILGSLKMRTVWHFSATEEHCM